MTIRNELMAYCPYNEQEKKDKELMLRYIDQFSDVLTRENEFAHFTASAWIVNKARTKVLMAFHNQYQSWAWMGGHADGNADLLHVALKETEEETGLKNIKPLMSDYYSIEILGVDGHMKKGKYVGTHVHLNVTFLIEADEGEGTTIAPNENSAIEWMNLDEAIERSSERYMKQVYTKLNEKLRNVQD
ncbi:NUDIX hydrolase [Rummeliibacillus sp. G93]|uniref:NUDIX hydrolase n=1 Tax=Rummeliibacillus sp. G93 TaxID=2939494 RepID=UPI00201C6492|nr:NUDIX hydrolase [Rummeliibacillus sp. G93]UQW96113.1 NUDIX hydrolase [Rummeliibacillus sp. G93]